MDKPEIAILKLCAKAPVAALKLDRLVFCNGLSTRCETLLNLGLIRRGSDEYSPRLYHITDAGLAYLKALEPADEYTWTVRLTVDPVWVADGLDFTDPEVLHEALVCHKYGYMRHEELRVEVLESPDANQIRVEQGGIVEGYAPRYED